MLVFVSDLHLTDGSSGQTINSGAFKTFHDKLAALVESVSSRSTNNTLKELKIVLLGDIFDVIRSGRWNSKGVKVRPWDPVGEEQGAVVESIVRDMLNVEENVQSLRFLTAIENIAAGVGAPFGISYVIGNHDWLINRYATCRKMVVQALGLSHDPATPFLTEFYDCEYRTVARHGDKYDDFNYAGDRDKSSVGDAIVIELLNKYPVLVQERIEQLLQGEGLSSAEKTTLVGEKTAIVNDLKEIDNIRPLLDAPSWILRILKKTKSEAAKLVIEKTWEECVDSFFKVKFIKKQDLLFWPDYIDLLQVALQLSSHTSKWALEKITELKKRFVQEGAGGIYLKKAYAESKVGTGEADYVVYGHTHDHVVIPMDQQYTGERRRDTIYFNTGTWRQTWNKVAFDPVNREFIGWKVMTYVAFYHKEENTKFNFEVWNGSLG
jgi:UDP-2,3-diacylglucosamine pyrophosphatase LpxH